MININEVLNIEPALNKGEKLLLLLINDQMCNACIKEAIIDLSMIEDEIGKDNIITVGQFKDKSALFTLSRKLEISYNWVYLNSKVTEVS